MNLSWYFHRKDSYYPKKMFCKCFLLIQAVSNLLENPVEPVNDYSFFDCLDSVSENSKALRDGMTDVSGNAKKGDMAAFDDAIKKVADAVIKLTEAASQVLDD